MYIYDGLLHLLRLLLGDLAEPLPLGAHNLPLSVSDELLVILQKICNLNVSASKTTTIISLLTHPLLGDDGSMVLDVVVRVDEAVVVHDLPLDLCLGHGDRLGQLGQHLRLGQLHVLAYKYK